MMSGPELDRLSINTIRFLSVDAVQQANSGHPGLPMGAAGMAYVLWTRHLRHNPTNPGWPDRDRFVLSAGHGSMLLYALLHLTGYDLPLDQIKRFRQWDSMTPGHPERNLTPGVEATTGPLGQGLGNAVGMAMAEAHLAARFNRPGHSVIDHRTYVIASDGDMMEGVQSEACSLAGDLQLGKLIVLYDDNGITLSGTTSITFREDVGARFTAYGWHVQRVEDGNDLTAVDTALRQAQQIADRPSLLMVRTIIGFGAPHKQGTFHAHGAPLGPDEVRAAKENLGWPVEPAFLIPDEARVHLRSAVERGARAEEQWRHRLEAYAAAFPDLGRELKWRLAGDLPPRWEADLPTFVSDPKGLATRKASEATLLALAARLPDLVGGSADLDPSTLTALEGQGDFQPASVSKAGVQGAVGGVWSPAGRNVHFGVREHGMGAIVNGLAYHGGFVPYGSTFLVFSDYMRPAVRLSALSRLGSIWVYTHDSVGLGEDGPTHQPVEHFLALRAIPDLLFIRPGDANETVWAWRVAIRNRRRPTALALTPGRADARSLDLCLRGRVDPGGLRAQRAHRGGRPAGPHPDRDGLRGPPDRRGRPNPGGEGRQGAIGVDALLGAVRGADGRVPGERPARLGHRAARRRGGAIPRLGALGGRRRRHHRARPFRSLGAGRRVDAGARIHHGSGRACGGSAAHWSRPWSRIRMTRA
jgi:transketolase